MLGEITFGETVERDDERNKHDVIRLGLRAHADTVIVTMYRRSWLEDPNEEDGKDHTKVVMQPLNDLGVEGDATHIPLYANLVIDLGDLVEAVQVLSGSATRIRARAEVEAKSEEQALRDAALEQQRMTADAALKKFDKLYKEHEEAVDRRDQLELEVRGLRATIEQMRETGRREQGRDLIEEAATQAEQTTEQTVSLSEAEDATT